SISVTSMPAGAKSRAMPWPMTPAPTIKSNLQDSFMTGCPSTLNQVSIGFLQKILGGHRTCEQKCVNVSECDIPLLASPQGGVAASVIKCREATETDADGVVFLFVFDRKTTPASRSQRLRDILLIARHPSLQ